MICTAKKNTRSYVDQRPLYEPTPDEIREACLAIQKGWTDAERRRRSTHRSTGPGLLHRMSIDHDAIQMPLDDVRESLLVDVA